MGADSKITKRSTGSHPVWNEDFWFPLEYFKEQVVQINIFDSDKFSEDDNLGSVRIDLEKVKNNIYQDEWYDLENMGKLKVKTSWLDITTETNQLTSENTIKVLSVFLGVIYEKGFKIEEKLTLKIEAEAGNDIRSSKSLEQNDIGETILNESFMLVTRGKEDSLTLKLTDSEENYELGKKIIKLSSENLISNNRLDIVTKEVKFIKIMKVSSLLDKNNI